MLQVSHLSNTDHFDERDYEKLATEIDDKESWATVLSVPRLTIYSSTKKQQSSLIRIKAVGILPFDAQTVFFVLNDLETRVKWDPFIVSSHYVERATDAAAHNENGSDKKKEGEKKVKARRLSFKKKACATPKDSDHSSCQSSEGSDMSDGDSPYNGGRPRDEILYVKPLTPFPLQPRDCIMHLGTWEKVPGQEYLVCIDSTTHDNYPEGKSPIRMQLYFGGVRLLQKDPVTTEFTVITQADLKGSIPKLVQNFMQRVAPIHYQRAIIAACKKYGKLATKEATTSQTNENKDKEPLGSTSLAVTT